MKYKRLYIASLSMFIVAVLINGLIRFISPPDWTRYSKINNGKVVIDKDFVEDVMAQYPPFFSFAVWSLSGERFLRWAFPLELEGIVQSARARSGLPPNAPFYVDTESGEKLLGPPDELASYRETYWYTRLKSYAEAVDREAMPYISVFGRLVVREILIQALSVQLRLMDAVNKNKEILEEKIVKPIIITGPPRTMTTHAHAILARHPDALFFRVSEQQDIFFPEGLSAADSYSEKDPRVFTIRVAIILLRLVRPFMPLMFRFDANEPWNTPQEDIFLTQLVMGTSSFETQTYVPSYSKLWQTGDNIPAFRFQKMCHQFLQWQRRNALGLSKNDPAELKKRWLMKTPEYSSFLPQVLSVYPDAQIVLTHRESVPVLKSFVPMLLYMNGFWSYKIDAALFAEYQVHALEQRIQHLVEQIDQIPQDQILHVPFKEFVDDNFSVIERICRFTGLELSDDVVALVKEYIANNPREGANRFEYRLSTFGPDMTSEKLKPRFARYSEKFKQYL